MTKIQIDLNDEVAERFELAAKILEIPAGEIISQFINIGKGKQRGLLEGDDICEVFNALFDPLEKFESFLREVKKDMGTFTPSKDSPPNQSVSIELNKPEYLMLQVVSGYHEQSDAEYIHERVRDAVHCEIQAISEPKYFEAWVGQSN